VAVYGEYRGGRAARRRRTGAIWAAAVGTVMILGTAGFALIRSALPDGAAAATPVGLASDSPSPSAAGETATPGTPTRTATPSPTRTTAKPKPSVTIKATRKPVNVPTPPPPRKPASPPPNCPTYYGPKAPFVDVRAALDRASGTAFWPSQPGITVPRNLMHAIAWQESGWQSTIVACDLGIGTMQVMPDTAAWLNQRFIDSYDVKTLTGNTMLGAEYIEWLIKYFGDVYAESHYDLDIVLDSEQQISMLDVVISAYNAGFGAVDTNSGLRIPNQHYVDNVRALMLSCPCDSLG